MTTQITPLEIPPALLAEVYLEARRAFPHECCGWLEGEPGNLVAQRIRRCVNAQAEGAHPTAPERGAEAAYVFNAADLLALNESLDSPNPAVVIYHSHPNGKAYFSPTDRAVARSPWGDGPAYPVQQLVVGIDAQRVVEAALFAWSDEAGDFVGVACFPGAAV